MNAQPACPLPTCRASARIPSSFGGSSPIPTKQERAVAMAAFRIQVNCVQFATLVAAIPNRSSLDLRHSSTTKSQSLRTHYPKTKPCVRQGDHLDARDGTYRSRMVSDRTLAIPICGPKPPPLNIHSTYSQRASKMRS